MVDDNKQLKKYTRTELTDMLQAAVTTLEPADFDAISVQESLNQLLETTGQKPGVLFSMIRLAVSWAPFSPALNDTLAALGKQTTIARLQRAIESATNA
jgi:glutamyl-tRNA synthetase